MYLSYDRIPLTDPTVKTASDLTVPAKATHAELQAGSEGDVNYTMDNDTDPGASRGMILRKADPPKTFLIEDVRRIRFCKSDNATALNVHYFAGRDI